MKQYTGMYIIRPDQTEDQIKACVADMSALFTNLGGELVSVDEWGMRDLAYEINDFKKGYYVKFVVNCNDDAVNEFDRIANIREDVIRHILVRD